MRKEKLKANFKKDRSIPNRNTTRSENVSRKQNKQMAHHAPVRRACEQSPRFLGIFAEPWAVLPLPG